MGAGVAKTLLEMTIEDWERPARAALGLLLAGDGAGTEDDAFGPVAADDTFLLLLNADALPVRFVVPTLHDLQSPRGIFPLSVRDPSAPPTLSTH